MPANQHLTWLDISDFTPGLWETPGAMQEFAAPPNAFVTLTDYVPQKGGGIQPFYAPTAVALTGIDSITTEECMGIYSTSVLTRAAPTGGGATGGTHSFDTILVTNDNVNGFTRIYRMDQSNGEIVWKKLFTSAVDHHTAGLLNVQFERFSSVSNNYIYYLASIGVEGKLYSIGYAYGVAGAGIDGTVTAEQSYFGPLAISQQRILIGEGESSSHGSRVHYSDVDAKTFTNSSQYVDIGAQREGAILSSINGIAPDDLLIGREYAPWVQVAGDLASSSTPIREMDDDFTTHRHMQQCPRVPGGIAFIDEGRVIITDGRQFSIINPMLTALKGNPVGRMFGWGTMAYLNDFLFIPSGYVYNFTTKSWFKQSALSGHFHWGNDVDVWIAKGGANFTITRLDSYQTLGTRVSTGVLQTVPYADKNGRNIDIQEVQIFANCYAATEFKVELIDQTGASVVTRYDTTSSAQRDVLIFKFPCTKSEYLSCKITPTAVDGTSSAPDIEQIRIGFGPNNLVVS